MLILNNTLYNLAHTRSVQVGIGQDNLTQQVPQSHPLSNRVKEK